MSTKKQREEELKEALRRQRNKQADAGEFRHG